MRYIDAKIIKNYAKRVIERNTKLLNKDDWNIIGKDLIKNDKTRAFYSKKIVMSNLELANNKIIEMLINNDIKPERALNLYKEAENIARTKENSGDLIKIADRYVELHDLKPQKVQISETRKDIDYTNMLPTEVKKTISTTKSIENVKKTDE